MPSTLGARSNMIGLVTANHPCLHAYHWVQELRAAVTVTDASGIIVYLNERAASDFEKYGGLELIGKNVLDCHPEPARTQTAELYETQAPNHYTIRTKSGERKIIHQMPWFREGAFAGIVEISIPIPEELPHAVRS